MGKWNDPCGLSAWEPIYERIIEISGSTARMIKKQPDSFPACWHRKILPASLDLKPQFSEACTGLWKCPKDQWSFGNRSFCFCDNCGRWSSCCPNGYWPRAWSHIYWPWRQFRSWYWKRDPSLQTGLNSPDPFIRGNIDMLEKWIARFKCFISRLSN